MLFVNLKSYSKLKTWKDFFPDGMVDISMIERHSSWDEMFRILFADPRTQKINLVLTECMTGTVELYPPPELLFNAFKLTPLNRLKAVILGQDPYFSPNQAMGLSFSVPDGQTIPSSLDNINNNLVKFKHIKKKPTNGNLEFWAAQGCLMLNTSLTVLNGSENINCHQNIWKWFTDTIIKYISANSSKTIFVLWGSAALEKATIIDLEEHELVVSSHPSGRSADKPLKNYSPFNEFDHFGKINQYLVKFKKTEIIWGY